MDSFLVTDEGYGIIRVDAETRLMRKPLAEAICHEVDRVAEGYDEFKILMNMGAISRGTPAAGWHTLRRMQQYPMSGLALFRANPFMRVMAGLVLGAARFRAFALFEDEGEARKWLENGPAEAPPPPPGEPLPPAVVVAAASVAGAAGAGALWAWRRRRSVPVI